MTVKGAALGGVAFLSIAAGVGWTAVGGSNSGAAYQIRARAKAARNARPETTCSALNLGFQIKTFGNGLRAAIWYPTTAAEMPYSYPGHFETAVSFNGPVAS